MIDTGISASRKRPVKLPWFARLPTGAKAFAILSMALLPLALIGVFAVLQTTRLNQDGARVRLRVAAAESARRLAIELTGDTNALRNALAAIVADPNDMPSCARVTGVFAAQFTAGTRFEILDRVGRVRCGTPIDEGSMTPNPGAVAASIIPGNGVLLAIGGPDRAGARVFFPAGFLDAISRPGDDAVDQGALLTNGDDRLMLRRVASADVFDRRQLVTTPIGVDGLTLEMTAPRMPITSPVIVATLLPLLMWFAAAGIAWFTVDRLLIRPLRRLQRDIAAYRPGDVISLPSGTGTEAVEIRELYDTFLGLSRTVVDHEAGLAEGLLRQTKLTREVHHRVKNNLQVIASLINFHARGAVSSEAAAAYASIQRRVDALAVVHRNHYAEMEVSRGLGLRSVIGELSANIRATAPEGTSSVGITLEVTPFLVTQDVAVAVAFLLTELIELAMNCNPAALIGIAVRASEDDGRAVIRVVSAALIQSETLESLIAHRYGRVIEGLSRQLRSKLHHDPLTGGYEIAIAVLGVE